jgi:voltage-dependent potassium channel beta subunit
MLYRFLGASGIKLSALSYGAWVTFSDQIDESVATDCMKTAYEAGVNFFDNAEVYAGGRAELMMGSILKKMGWKRSDLVISTKIFWGGKGPNDQGLSRKHILEGTDKALTRLQQDYVDLIFCHRPDLDTPIEETVRAMSHVINQGKALYWGTSEWSREQIRAAYDIARREHLIPPTMEQPQYNMFHRERVEKEYFPLYAEIGLGTTIWSPLAGGILTGKYKSGIPSGTRAALPGYQWIRQRVESETGREQIAQTDRLKNLAEELGISLAQMAIAWCLQSPFVSTVITGASTPEQVQENMSAVEIVPKLTDDVMTRIEEVLDNKPGPEPSFR